jgi:hypothetical protein
MMVMVVVMMHFTGVGDGRRDNCQSEQSCENIGE